MSTSPSNWEWQGHAGHFIGANECRFRLATIVGSGRWLVSTVGDYYPREEQGDPASIGFNRTFETMVFRCSAERHVCGCPIIADLTELDMRPYQSAQDATAGHMAVCAEWAERTEANAR